MSYEMTDDSLYGSDNVIIKYDKKLSKFVKKRSYFLLTMMEKSLPGFLTA